MSLVTRLGETRDKATPDKLKLITEFVFPFFLFQHNNGQQEAID